MYFQLPVDLEKSWLVRTRDGRREASSRMWLLIFLVPGLFFAAAIWLTFLELSFLHRAQIALGEVVRIYENEDWDPWHGQTKFYSPVFRYEFAVGQMTDSSLGEASPKFKFEVGARYEILFDTTRKTDVKLNDFWFVWSLPLTIAAIAFVMLLPALSCAWLLSRWLEGGKQLNNETQLN